MKINEKKSRRAEQLGQPAGRPKTVREAFARINKKHLVMLIVNCVVFIGLYRLFMNAAFEFTVQKVVVLTYMIGASVLILAYVIYNRGFSGRGVTAETLPDTMTEKEKDDYIADTAEREKKSKWMMTFIVPLLLALLIDLLDMYVLKNLSL